MNNPYEPGRPGIPRNLMSEYGIIRPNYVQNLKRKLALQKLEWLYSIPFNGIVPANDGLERQVDIRSDAHFECHLITGDFTTLDEDLDDDINHLTVRISDGSNDLRLMESPVPLNLFLSPGRTASTVAAGNPTNQLFFQFPFEHIFVASGGIVLDFRNNASTDNTVNLLFWGKKLRALEK